MASLSMYYGTNSWKLLIFSVSSFLLLALLCVTLPWYLAPLIIGLLILCSLIFLKIEAGTYSLIFLTINLGHQPQLVFPAKWSTMADRIPIFPLSILIILFIRLMLDRSSRLRQNLVKVGLNTIIFLLFLWSFLTLFWVPNIKHSVVQLTIFIANLALFYTIINFVDQDRIHKRVIWCLILSGVILASVSYILYFLPKMIYSISSTSKSVKLEFLIPGGASLIQEGQWRLVGLGWWAAELAMTLNVIISLAIGMIIVERRKLIKLILTGLVIFMISATLLTMAKAGVLALFIMLHFLIFIFPVLRKHLLRNLLTLYIVLTLIFLIQIVLIGETKTPRILEYGAKGKQASLISRTELWKQGTEKFTNSFGLGLGVGGINYYAQPLPHAHSLYFDYIFDFGLIGLLFISYTFLYFFKHFLALTKLKLEFTYLKIMGLATIGGLIAIGIHCLVDFGYNTTPIWLFLGLSAATFHLNEKEYGNFF